MLGVALGVIMRLALPITWDAPEDCPSAEEFRRRVLEQADTADAESSSLVIAVAVQQRVDRRFTLVLELDGGEGIDRRELEGETCEAVVDAAALIVSLRIVEENEALVPPAVAPTPPATAPETSAPEPKPKLAATPATAATIEERSRIARPSGFVAVAAGPALGILPGVGAGVTVDGGVQGRWWRAGLSVRGFPVRRAPHRSEDGVEGRFDLVEGGVFGCGLPAVGSVAFPLCVRVDAGAMRGVGEGPGVTQGRPGWIPWVGFGASAAVAWRVVREVAPYLGVEGVGSPTQPSFSVGGVQEPLFTAGAFGFRAWLGLEVHFGPARRERR